jgi:hypothetical protein
VSVDEAAFARVQAKLDRAWRAHRPHSGTGHLVVEVPSYNVDPVLLAHYAERIPALEQRYLCSILLLRDRHTRLAYVTSTEPPADIVDAYLSLLPPSARAGAEERLTVIALDDPSPRPLAEKLLERPDVIARLRDLAGDAPALVEPWNVGVNECRLAVELDMPLYGAHPRFWRLATKTGGRRLFRETGVPLPDGFEGLRSLPDAADAISALRLRHPGLAAVIVKLDDSASGDGNAVIDLSGLPSPGAAGEAAGLANRLMALPGWYVQTFTANHGIVEVRIDGDDFRSPSAQLSITPAGDVVVLSTHDQILGGHAGQVYQGCRFPADPGYAAEVARLAGVVGERLATEGVIGRLAVDFAAVRRGDDWDLYALEINLRKGGTTHPFSTARSLTGGRYDTTTSTFTCSDGQAKHYVATDNLLDPAWRSLDPVRVRHAILDAGLGFDLATRTGVVPHMLSGIPIDGRFGLTAIADSAEEAQRLHDAVRPTVDALL